MEFACYNTLVVHHKLVSLLFYAVLASASYVVAGTSSTTIPKRYRVVAKLIHPDSILLSKYYYDNHINNTPISVSSPDPANSWAKHTYYYPTPTGDDYYGDKGNVPAALGVLPDDRRACFLVNMSIGEPSVPQLLVMDTGSHLLWVQCRPCVHCIHQVYTPIFNPSASSTYRLFPCGDGQYYPTCSDLVPGGHCNSLSECGYFLQYMDRTNTTGILGIDSFTFMSNTDVEPTGTLVPDVVFGCGHNNHGIRGGYTGVLGLGANDISLVTQLGSKFSYCIGSASDPHYTYNHLIIGDGAMTSEGYSTPMEIYNGRYHLTLESIIIGDKTLNIDPKIFQRSSIRGGVVIDSGSTYTYLTSDGYEPLRAEVERLMDGVMERLRFPGHVCYKGIVGRDLKGFPAVTFQFAGEADLVLGMESMFRQVGNDSLCMAVRMSEAHGLGDLSVIGIMAQQYYNIGYDLAAMKLSFLSIDCQLLRA